MLPLNVLTVATALLCTGAAGSLATTVPVQSDSTETCNVRAWVRAQDLSPNSVVDGDLRIKVSPSCKEKIASVALQLQLDEFAEVKYLRNGAVRPPQPGSGTPCVPAFRLLGMDTSSWLLKLLGIWGDATPKRAPCQQPPQPRNGPSWLAAFKALGMKTASRFLGLLGLRDNDDDDGSALYYNAPRDPALWAIGAEERTAWQSAATLVRGHFDYARPLIVPFSVAVPNVNYPPGQDQSWANYYILDEKSVANGQNAYHYTVRVTFESGRTVEVPAGYTTFHPMHTAPLPARPFAVNVTFAAAEHAGLYPADGCLNDIVYTGQVVLDNGNVVRVGDTLKGRIMLNYRGPATAEHVHADVRSSQHNHWAQGQVSSGGSDHGAETQAQAQAYVSAISASSCRYAHLFGHTACNSRRQPPTALAWQSDNGGPPYVPFEVDVTTETIPDFPAFYVTFASSVQVKLGISRPEFRRCLIRHRPGADGADAEDAEDAGDADPIEEGLWDPWVPAGASAESPSHQITHMLSATIPITLVNTYASGDVPVHYLAPGAASPLVLARPPPSPQPVAFPPSHAVVRPEPLANTSARMLSDGYTYGYGAGVSPAAQYFAGAYAGLLWDKKRAANLTDKPAGHGGGLGGWGKALAFEGAL